MAFGEHLVEGLLGALSGGLKSVGEGLTAQQQAKVKEKEDKRKFQRNLLQGAVLQALKPGSKNLNFGDDANEALTKIFGEDFGTILTLVQGAKKPRVFQRPPSGQPQPEQTSNEQLIKMLENLEF